MKKLIKQITLFAPFFLLVLALHSILIDFEVIFPDPTSITEISEEKTQQTVTPKIEFRKGIWSRIDYLSYLLSELGKEDLPVDSTPEETMDAIKRILIGQRILLAVILFYMVLCFSVFVSRMYKAWFYPHLSYILYPISIFWLMTKIFLHISLIVQGHYLSILGLLFFVASYVACILALHSLGKDASETKTFETLRYSSNLEEEGRAPQSQGNGSVFSFILHFIVIIFVGLLIGNLVYIPLFLLQKHYVTEFSIFILSLVLLLSGFYIYNYGKVGGEKTLSGFQNILVSASYLQFRFLRNGFIGLFATLLIVLFIVVLFVLLIFNIDLIQSNMGLFGKGTEF